MCHAKRESTSPERLFHVLYQKSQRSPKDKAERNQITWTMKLELKNESIGIANIEIHL